MKSMQFSCLCYWKPISVLTVKIATKALKTSNGQMSEAHYPIHYMYVQLYTDHTLPSESNL